MRELFIDDRRIAPDEPCYVIAEIGGNHGGSLETAKMMVHEAAECGCDAVKFQKRTNGTLYSTHLLNQPYDNEHSYGKTYGEHRDALELSIDGLLMLRSVAVWRQIECFSTAFDEDSADALIGAGMPAIKIASGGLTDEALLTHVAQFRKPIILSTGGGTFADVDRAVNLITKVHNQLALLHCTAAYPSVFEELNLRCIPAMIERYPDQVIGWSCHVHNISMAMQAHAYGARIIEAHFTLNRALKGTDHAFSLEPATMTKLCKDLRRAHVAAGDGIKRWYASEVKPISKMRRRHTPDGLRITGECDVIH